MTAMEISSRVAETRAASRTLVMVTQTAAASRIASRRIWPGVPLKPSKLRFVNTCEAKKPAPASEPDAMAMTPMNSAHPVRKEPVAPSEGRARMASDPAPARRRAMTATQWATSMTMTAPMAKENQAPLPAYSVMKAGVNAMTALGAMFATLCMATSTGDTVRLASPPEWSCAELTSTSSLRTCGTPTAPPPVGGQGIRSCRSAWPEARSSRAAATSSSGRLAETRDSMSRCPSMSSSTSCGMSRAGTAEP